MPTVDHAAHTVAGAIVDLRPRRNDALSAQRTRDRVLDAPLERRGNRAHVVEHLPGIDLARSAGDKRKVTVRQLFETRRVIEMPMVEQPFVRPS